ncbi:MAG TPA: response regulator transcription factor, partial [Ktedonobacterales bacterium]
GRYVRVLLIHHDRDLVEMTKHLLQTYSYDVRRAYTGAQAREEWTTSQPDIVLLDLTLPEGNALALGKQLQAQHDALILALVPPHDLATQVRGLEELADAVLPTPFLPAQLMAQLHALTRRTRASVKTRPAAVVSVDALTVDAMRNVATVGSKAVKLTPIESKLLHLLAANVETVCTSEVIVSHIWGYEDEGAACLIKSHVRRLREKIEPDPSAPRYVVTIAGVGYMLARQTPEVIPAAMSAAS